MPFVLTTLVGKKKGIDKEAEAAQAEAEILAAAWRLFLQMKLSALLSAEKLQF